MSDIELDASPLAESLSRQLRLTPTELSDPCLGCNHDLTEVRFA